MTRNLQRFLTWNKLMLLSTVVGAFLGISGISDLATPKATASWQCPTAPQGCLINGCRRSSEAKDSYWVCNYSGTNCPPLTSCEPY